MLRAFAISLTLCAVSFAAGPESSLTPINEIGFAKLVNAHKGKVVLYDFWATWCAPCRAEMPQILDLEQKLRVRGVEVVTISADDREHRAAAEKFNQMFRVQGTRYIKQADNDDDDRFMSAIDAKWSGALPALFLYDRSGHRVRSFIGQTEMPAIEAAIRKLL